MCPEDLIKIGKIGVVDRNKEIERIVRESELSDKGGLEVVLRKYSDYYSRSKNDCGKVDCKYQHVIQGGIPPPQRQYKINSVAEQEISETIKELSQQGIITKLKPNQLVRSNSPLQAVAKNDGTWRLVTNYKALNKLTVPDTRYLINCSEACGEIGKGREWLSKIDLANSYWSIPLAEESREKTAFTFRGDQYLFNVLAQGLKNAGNHFQSTLLTILSGIPVIVYIDDILLSTATEEEHLKLLEQTLDRLTKAGLKPSLKKMEIGKREVDFLGFKLGRDTKALTTSTRAKLEELEKSAPPRTRKQLQSLLGTLNYIRELIPKYSREAKVLYSGTKEGKWSWTEQMEQARLKLIRMALNSGELERRHDSLPLHVHVTEQEDEAMLTLSNEDGKAPIAFLTHQQEAAMKRYDQNSAERVLASVTKRLLQLKAIAKEQPIVIFSMAGELARIKKNLVMDQALLHRQRWDRWAIVLGDTQLDWRLMFKYHDRHQHLPKYITDNSERAGKVRWGFLVKHNGQLITSGDGEITGSAQLAEVTAVLKALQKAEELGHKEVVLTSDSEYVTDGINKELETWKANGFHNNARNKPMAHRGQWMEIAELLQKITTHCYHQVSHTKQDSEAAQGNREIDKLIGQVKMPETIELFRKLHDELNHPSVNMIQMELRL